MGELECVELPLSDCKNIIDFRIDANTYKKSYIQTDEQLKKKGAITISSQMKSIQNFGAYSLCNDIVFVDNGIPFLMTQNIRKNYIDWSNLRYIDETSHKMLYKSHCSKGQVLVTMAGEYLGRASMYDEEFACSSNQAIAKITLKNSMRAFVLSTFINTIYGQNQINRLKTITGQPNINMSLIQSLYTPDFSDDFCKVMNGLKDKINLVKSQSTAAYAQAEEILLAALDMQDFTPSTEPVAIKTLSESFGASGRLDSEYYQGKYDELFGKIVKFSPHKLGDIATIKKSIEPGSDCYGDEDVPFVRVSDITKHGISEPSIKILRDVVADIEKLYPKKDTILLSKDGSVGIAYKVEKDEQFITSGALLHLNVKDKNVLPDYLTLVLNSIIVQLQAERDAGGSIIQHWKPSEIAEVAIPIIDIAAQTEIADLVQYSFAQRKKSEQLLESAKRAVEMAIEDGEDKSMKWLEGEV